MEDSFINLSRGNRLKVERKKFPDLTQKGAAEIAGIKEQSWVRFEKRGHPFDLKFTQLLEDYGFDMMYVIFGVPKKIQPDQAELIELYNRADKNQKEKIIQMIRLMTPSD